jgi:hypothetical protein
MALLFAILGATIAIVNPLFNWSAKLPKTSDAVTIPWYVTLAIVAVIAIAFVVYEFVRARRKKIENPTTEYNLQDVQVLMTLGYDHEREAQKEPGYRLKLWRNYAVDLALAGLLAMFFLCEGKVMAVVPALAEVGSQLLRPCGIDTRFWDFWREWPLDNLLKSDDFLSVLFLTLGAFLSSSFGGNFGLYQEFTPLDILKGAVGGFAIGFGGMLAGGDNLCGVIGGISSSSVDGFLWLACAGIGAGIVAFLERWLAKRAEIQQRYTQVA